MRLRIKEVKKWRVIKRTGKRRQNFSQWPGVPLHPPRGKGEDFES
jgi:hypothetical protein